MYSVMAAAGILSALLYLKISIKKHHQALEADVELAFIYGIVGVLMGAKLLSLVTVFPELIEEFHYLFTETALFLRKYLYGGFVFYGGFYGALLAVWIYAKACRVSFSDLLCVLLPVVPLVHGFGRIGCFCMGCCYGKPSDFLGIAFHNSEIAPNGAPLFPVQLLEAGLEFALFVILARMSSKKAEGTQMLATYLVTYGISRFFLEFCRGDSYRGFIGMLSLSQIISLVSILWGGMLFLRPIIRRE